MITGDSELWTDNTIPHNLLITDGTVIVTGKTYSVSGATITFENDLIESEKFELYQSLCSQPQLQFGSCESSMVKFTIHENIPGIKDKRVNVYMIPDHDASKMIQLGVFTVAEDKLSADRTKRGITSYDDMYKILNTDVASWYNTVLPNSNSSMTLAQFRASLLSYLNITAEPTTLVNDSMVIKRTIEPETLSGADVIRPICELNGVFGQITNESKFKFVELSPNLDAGLFPSDTLYPADDLYPQDVNHSIDIIHHNQYISAEFEDWNVESITGLTIRTDDKDVGVTVGTTSNCYVITANFLVYGYNATDLRTVATNALSKMTNRYYRPCSVQAVGNPLHEVGDGIRIRTQYRGIVTYILERRLTGIQALRDTYTANGEQKFTEQLNSVSSMFKQLEGKTTEVKADVDGFKVTVRQEYVSKDGVLTDLNAKINQSSMEITANGIEFKSTGAFTVDSSNFRVNEHGDITIRSVTFDSAGVQYMTIDNGELTVGDTQITDGYINVGNAQMNSRGFGVGNTELTDGELNLGGVPLTTNYQGKLLVNGSPVMMGGSSADITCRSIDAGSIVVDETSIDSAGIYTNRNLTVGLHSINGTADVVDTNGNTVTVWTVS